MEDARRETLRELETRLKYFFRDVELLNTALTHTSYIKGEGRKSAHNERLEFLGDAVLELSVSEYLYNNYPKLNEGQMTRARAITVCEPTLFAAAKQIGIGEYLRLSHGEENTGGREKPSILSDALEAVIGAIFLDGGMDAAKEFVLSFAVADIKKAAAGAITKDFKTQLQEFVQMEHRGTLKYELTGQSGPDHKKTFMMQVCLNGEVIGRGEGSSKQTAGQSCAKQALIAFGQLEA